jgi:sugar O-acyltransferase (sialic acid O-acetyltransferase NeuD family)
MKQLVIIGAGGFGRDVLSWARQANGPWEIKGFLDDNLLALEGYRTSVPILSTVNDYVPASDDVFVCAIGQVAPKKRCVELIQQRGGEFVQIIHPSAVLGDNVRLGQGVVLCPNSAIGADAVLDDFVAVNFFSSVGHDSHVGRWSQLHCHVDVTGHVEVGESVLFGSHASVLPRLRIGNGATIGAGAIVTRDVGAGTIVFGVPARPLMKREVSHA